MLTKEQIVQVSRLLDQTGEPRPGFDRESDGFKGQHSEKTRISSYSKKMVEIRLDYEKDPVSGDLRIVKK